MYKTPSHAPYRKETEEGWTWWAGQKRTKRRCDSRPRHITTFNILQLISVFSALPRSYVTALKYQMWKPNGLAWFTTQEYIMSLPWATEWQMVKLWTNIIPLSPSSTTLKCTHYIITGEFHGHLLGDRGYPCQPTLMTPYHDPEPGPQQWYNVAHCRTRAWVEMTIGILKARFQCLRTLRVTPGRAGDNIVACVVLHNIATIRGEQHPAVQYDLGFDHPLHSADVQDGRAVRDILCRTHFHQPWHWNKQIINISFCLLYFLQIEMQQLIFIYCSDN